jgi:peptidoglycan/xylan/chitin deacetylase (PgdA/CDA1 family)
MLLAGLAVFTPQSAGCAAGARGWAVAEPRVAIFCYHDVSGDSGATPLAVSPELLRRHVRALRAGGWLFVPLSRVVEASRDSAEWMRLPPSTAVLSFDDGYKSLLSAVVAVLESEGIPAAVAIVPAFLDAPPPGLPPVLTWDELREVARNPYIETIAHSDDLHRYVTANPYRDSAPAVTTRRYVLEESRYETRAEYRARIGADCAQARARLAAELGREVTALAWPYGEYNDTARAIARRAGFPATLGLDGRLATWGEARTGLLSRFLVDRNTPLEGPEQGWRSPVRKAMNALELEIDDLYDRDPAVLDSTLERAAAQARASGVTDVILPLLAAASREGAWLAWFRNHQVPDRADVASRVAHRFAQAGARIWWRLPAGERFGGAAIDLLADAAVYLPAHGFVFDETAAGAIESARAKEARLDSLRTAIRVWRPAARFAVAIAAEEARSTDRLRDRLLRLDAVFLRVPHAKDDAGAAQLGALAAARALRGRAAALRSARGPAGPVVVLFDTPAGVDSERITARALRAARSAGAMDLGVRPVGNAPAAETISNAGW